MSKLNKEKLTKDIKNQIYRVNNLLDKTNFEKGRLRLETQRDVYQSIIDNINNGAYNG